jgi:hemerythrin-like metal-binding protein
MQPIPWKEQYEVGVKEIDEQHQHLLDIINQVIVSIEKRNEWKTTSSIIDSLIHYAYNHFSTEERYMLESGYPELSWHIGLHLEFIRKVFVMSERAKQRIPGVHQEILSYLEKWYYEHVLEIDRKYMSYFVEKGIK